MADHTALAAVSRTIRTLLLDRMTMEATITIAPPDITVADADGARVNIYLYQVIENSGLSNQEIPGHGHPAAYGRPPLSLNLRYLLTAYGATENQVDSDLNAQTILGDAMRVLHEFGGQVHSLPIANLAGLVGEPVLDEVLRGEFEHAKLTLFPATLDDITKIWSAIPEQNFRRSVVYEAAVVQVETRQTRVAPRPVERRRLHTTTRRRPVIQEAYVTPAPAGPIGELRVRVGEEVTIIAANTRADRLFVRFGELEPIRITPTGADEIRISVPDDTYPADLDHPAPRPIPAADRLQPGPLEVRVIAEHPIEVVAGALDRGVTLLESRQYVSNSALLQLVPRVTGVLPPNGPSATILRVTGTRLWHNRARVAEVIVGDAAILIRAPGPADLFAAPTSTQVEVPLADAVAILPAPVAPGDQYPVAVQVDGARSRDALLFRYEP